MQFHPTPLSGAYMIGLEKRGDERGFFAPGLYTKHTLKLFEWTKPIKSVRVQKTPSFR